MPDIRKKGAEAFIVGSGRPEQARDFLEKGGLDVTVFCNPDLAAYKAAGMKRGLLRTFNPKSAVNALGSLARGFRQGRTQGDAFQQGGVLVVSSAGKVLFHRADAVTGEKVPLAEILASLG